MKKKNIVIFTSLLAFFIVSLSACKSENNSKIENAELNQVTNGGTLQNRGSYKLKDGTLQIFKELQTVKDINQDPSDLIISDNEKEEIIKLLDNELSEEDKQTNQNELFQTYEKEIKKAYVQVDKKNEKTVIYADDYKKEFTWLDDQGNRLVDSNKIEYSFTKE